MANRIKELRKEVGMTQSDLGDKFSVVKQTVSAWERGLNEPPLEILHQMSLIFDASIDYIIGRSNDRMGSTVSVKTQPSTSPDEERMLSYLHSCDNKRQLFRLIEKFLSLDDDRKDIALGKLVELNIQQAKSNNLAPTGTEGAWGK